MGARREATCRSVTEAAQLGDSEGPEGDCLIALSDALLRHHHVIHIRVAGDAPLPAKRIVYDTGAINHPHAVAAHETRELVRRDEALPFMRALRQPAQHIFSADDR